MKILYRVLLAEFQNEALFFRARDALRASGIKFRAEVERDRLSLPHASTMAGTEVLGRSAKPPFSGAESGGTYKIFIRPKDRKIAEMLINRL